nr:hypothetical protein [Tanacetum cinerariifolium]
MAKTINGEAQLHAKVDDKKIIVTKSFVRRDLRLADEEGIDCLLNSTIFEQIALIGKPKRKDTHVPQPSGPTESVTYEAVHKELGDRLMRAATTASSLEEKQDSGGGPRCQETIGDTIAQTRFERVSKHSNDSLLVRENTKTTQQQEIASLKRMVKKLKKRNRSRTHKLKRLYKVGLCAKVESSGDEESLGEDASKQERKINVIDADEDITLVNDADNELELLMMNVSAFVTRRQVSDNVLLIRELMNGYNSKKKGRRFAFKVDIQKAYDTINWEFLEFSLVMFGFHPKMIKWIMECLRTASYFVSINGESHGFKYHWGCKELRITHLLFADDLLLLCYGNLKFAFVLRRALDEFTLASGLYPSMEKSSVYVGNVPNNIKCEILMVMPFKEESLPLLRLKDKIRRFVGVKIGNGMSCSIWFDRWHSNGPLCKIIDHGVLFQYNLRSDAKVFDFVDDNGWKWSIELNGRFFKVTNVPVLFLNPDAEDNAFWIDNKGKKKAFCMKEVWKGVRNKTPKVIWHKHDLQIAKYPRYEVCFLQVSNVWGEVISSISNRPANNSIWSVIQSLVFGAIVYYIWQERNVRLFRDSIRSEEVLFNTIVETCLVVLGTGFWECNLVFIIDKGVFGFGCYKGCLDQSSLLCSCMFDSVRWGSNDQFDLPCVTQVSIAGTSSTEQPPLKDKSMWSDQEKRIQKIDRLARSLLIQGLPNDIYSFIDSNKTAKDLWDALARHMLGTRLHRILCHLRYPFHHLRKRRKRRRNMWSIIRNTTSGDDCFQITPWVSNGVAGKWSRN